MKRVKFALMALVLVLVTAIPSAAMAGEAAPTPEEAGLIPIRAIFEDMGGIVSWQDEDRSIHIAIEGGNIILFAGQTAAYVNDSPVTLQDAVVLLQGMSFISGDDLTLLLDTFTAAPQGVCLEEQGHLSETILDAHLFAEILMDYLSVTGMVVAIVDTNEEFTWIQGFGYADTAQGIPVDADTVFPVASISKTLTAIAVMQLVEDGIIGLDVPIVEYLPDFSILPHPTLGGDYRNITARMLLTHTAGIPSQFYHEDLFEYLLSMDGHNPDFLNTFLYYLAQHYLENPEDTVFSYSNNGYVLLGVLVAAKTGNDNFFDDFVRYTSDFIFTPAGMARSGFVLDDNLWPYLAGPYLDADTPDEFIFMNDLPTASMITTGNDMARLMHILLNDDGQLVAPGTIGLMMQPHDYDFTDMGLKYGLGFAHFPTGTGFYAIGHNGERIHYNAYMVLDVDSGLGVFVATNTITGYAISHIMALMLLQGAMAEKSN